MSNTTLPSPQEWPWPDGQHKYNSGGNDDDDGEGDDGHHACRGCPTPGLKDPASATRGPGVMPPPMVSFTA